MSYHSLPMPEHMAWGGCCGAGHNQTNTTGLAAPPPMLGPMQTAGNQGYWGYTPPPPPPLPTPSYSSSGSASTKLLSEPVQMFGILEESYTPPNIFPREEKVNDDMYCGPVVFPHDPLDVVQEYLRQERERKQQLNSILFRFR